MSDARLVPIVELEIGDSLEITLLGDARIPDLPHEQVCSICRAEFERMRQALKVAEEMPRPTWEDD